MKKLLGVCSLVAGLAVPFGASAVNLPITPSQRAYLEREIIAIVHWGINTFTGQEWGNGYPENMNAFPKDIGSTIDPHQWVRAMKAGGIREVIMVSKHHDGFCLWPATNNLDYSTATLTNWPDFHNYNVPSNVFVACQKEGVDFGVYLSPWDRHQGSWGKTDGVYQKYFHSQYQYIFNTFDVSEIWIDRALGGLTEKSWYGGAKEGRELPPGGADQYYDFKTVQAMLNAKRPNAIVFDGHCSNCVVWAGNEEGLCPEDWSYDRKEDKESYFGAPEVDTPFGGTPESLAGGGKGQWFWHPGFVPKSLKKLVDIYFTSVGRGGVLNFGIAPDQQGRIPDNEAQRLKEFGDYVRLHNASDVFADATVRTETTDTSVTVTLTRSETRTFNVVDFGENLDSGQIATGWTIEAREDGEWTEIATSERAGGANARVGWRRMARLDDAVEADAVRITATGATTPALERIHVRYVPTVSEEGMVDYADSDAQEWQVRDSEGYHVLPTVGNTMTFEFPDELVRYEMEIKLTNFNNAVSFTGWPAFLTLYDEDGYSMSISVTPPDDQKKLFLTSHYVTGSQMGTLVGTVNSGNNDAGSIGYWKTDGTRTSMTLVLRNEGERFALYQDGKLILKTDKNFGSDGKVKTVTIGQNFDKLGGTIKSIRYRPLKAGEVDVAGVMGAAHLWLDASDVTVEAGSEVTTWPSHLAGGRAATKYTASPVKAGPTLLAGGLRGRNVVDFGDAGSNRDLEFERSSSIRTVVMVAQMATGTQNAFFLGDHGAKNYTFHRGPDGQYLCDPHGWRFKNGTYRSGEKVADPYYTQIPSGYAIYTLVANSTEENSAGIANCICQDRAQSGRNGGKQLAELAIFNAVLSDAERAAVEEMLTDKWFSYVATVTKDVKFSELTWVPEKPAGGFAADDRLVIRNASGAVVTLDEDVKAGKLIVGGDLEIDTRTFSPSVPDNVTLGGTLRVRVAALPTEGGQVPVIRTPGEPGGSVPTIEVYVGEATSPTAIAAPLSIVRGYAGVYIRDNSANTGFVDVDDPATKSRNCIWFDADCGANLDTGDWENRSFPIGNGRIGASVMENRDKVRFALNEISFWSGGTNKTQSAYVYGPYANRDQFGNYQPFGDFFIEQPGLAGGTIKRALDLTTGVAQGEIAQGGVTYTRRTYASRPDQVIVTTLEASKLGMISGKFSLWPDHTATVQTVVDAGKGKITYKGTLANDMAFAATAYVVAEGGTVSVTTDEATPTTVTYTNGGGSDNSMPIRTVNNAVCVDGATKVTVVIAMNTDYVCSDALNWKRIDDTPEHIAETNALAAAGVAVDEPAMRAASVAKHQQYFNTCDVQLGETASAQTALPTPSRLGNYKTGTKDTELEATLFQMGRYLLIGSSGDAIPANLQGLWNDKVHAPWASDYHTNINIQENYWSAEVTGLSELHLSLFNWLGQAMPTMRADTAKNFKKYGTQEAVRGWTARVSQNPFGAGGWTQWNTPINAWYALHYWEHYQFTMDEDFLEASAYPVLKEASEFWCDYLKPLLKNAQGVVTNFRSNVEGGLTEAQQAQLNAMDEGTLVATYGWSHEHGPNEDGVTFDQQLVRNLFNNTIKAAKKLGVDSEFVTELETKRSLLATNQIGKGSDTVAGGYLQEWLVDRPGYVDTSHRHTSHLMAVFPCNEINMYDCPEFVEAAANSLLRRGEVSDSRRSWTWPWRGALWARMHRPVKAHDQVEGLLKYNTLNNLWTTHTPYQIDGNLSYPAAVAEMLVQSQVDGQIELMAGVDTAEWPNGSVKGLRARGGIELNFEWKDGAIKAYELKRTTESAATSVKMVFNGTERTVPVPSSWKFQDYTAKMTKDVTWSTRDADLAEISGIYTGDPAVSIVLTQTVAQATLTFDEDVTGKAFKIVSEEGCGTILQGSQSPVLTFGTYDFSESGNVTLGFNPGAANVVAGGNTVLGDVGTGNVTIAADKMITLTGGTLKESKTTNVGSIRFEGGTAEKPIDYQADLGLNTNLGAMTLVGDTYARVTAHDNKVYNVAGAGAGTSLLEIRRDVAEKGTGTTVGSRFRKLTLVANVGGDGFWIEREDSFDATVDLVAKQAVVICGYDPTIGTLSGSGNLGKNSSLAIRTLTITPHADAEYSGATDHSFIIAAGAGTQTLSGQFTGNLTVMPGGRVALRGEADPWSITDNGTVDVGTKRDYTIGGSGKVDAVLSNKEAASMESITVFTRGGEAEVSVGRVFDKSGTDITGRYDIDGNTIKRRFNGLLIFVK